MYIYGWFTLLYGRNQHNIVEAIILQLKKNLLFENQYAWNTDSQPWKSV